MAIKHLFWVCVCLLTACASSNVDIHYLTQSELNAKFPSSAGTIKRGYAKWDLFKCNIWMITPEEFAILYPFGYMDEGDGEYISTWDDLMAHELRHCDEGNFHPETP